MDYDKLIEHLRRRGLGNGCALGPHSGLYDDAATALSTLQAENEKLRAELEKVMRERDAAQSLLAERIGVRGAEPITTAFGLPIDRLRELAQADREGRCVVLPEGGCEDKDGENALKSAMHTCFYYNNPVTRFIADAVAEKLTRQEAQAALRREQE